MAIEIRNQPLSIPETKAPQDAKRPEPVTIEGNDLVIRVPLMETPQLSSSGKSLIVASTDGPQMTNLRVEGRPLRISVTATVKVMPPKKWSGKHSGWRPRRRASKPDAMPLAGTPAGRPGRTRASLKRYGSTHGGEVRLAKPKKALPAELSLTEKMRRRAIARGAATGRVTK